MFADPLPDHMTYAEFAAWAASRGYDAADPVPTAGKPLDRTTTVNQIRAKQDQPPIPGGDVPVPEWFRPVGTTRLDASFLEGVELSRRAHMRTGIVPPQQAKVVLAGLKVPPVLAGIIAGVEASTDAWLADPDPPPEPHIVLG